MLGTYIRAVDKERREETEMMTAAARIFISFLFFGVEVSLFFCLFPMGLNELNVEDTNLFLFRRAAYGTSVRCFVCVLKSLLVEAQTNSKTLLGNA